MRLINLAYGEGFHNALVGSLHCHSVIVIERAFVLIYHYSRIIKRLVAVAVKLLCKKSLSRAEGVG